MEERTKPVAHQVHRAPVTRRMLQGATIGLVLISLFLYSAGQQNPAWPKYWIARPLIIVPIAGAMGGVFYYVMDNLRYRGGWKTALANMLSLLGFLFALWIGTILGLDGTLWN